MGRGVDSVAPLITVTEQSQSNQDSSIFMLYISLHAVLPLLMLQIYRTGITFIYTVRI